MSTEAFAKNHTKIRRVARLRLSNFDRTRFPGLNATPHGFRKWCRGAIKTRKLCAIKTGIVMRGGGLALALARDWGG